MWRRIQTTPVRRKADVAAFFDGLAPDYEETHGPPERLLRDRLALIRDLAALRDEGLILEIGCGNSKHLLPLIGDRRRGLGIDLSPAMLRAARLAADLAGRGRRVSFRVDDAEVLSTVADSTVDLAYCVGSFEHFLDKPAALRNAHRVLKTQARFVCLTPNGGSIYYRWFSPLLGLPAKHLSTDDFLTADRARALLVRAGFDCRELGYWSFIPKGDMPAPVGCWLQVLDAVGRAARVPFLRGGLFFVGVKCERPPSSGPRRSAKMSQ